MLKQLGRRPRTCSTCLGRSVSRRVLGATAPSYSQYAPSCTDDSALRSLFDSQEFWRHFSAQKSTGNKKGLLQNRFLTSPKGYRTFVEEALQKCSGTPSGPPGLVEKLQKASTVEDYKSFPRDFDRLSDQLCRVIDSVEFVRNVHPDHRVQHAATQVHGAMFEYMNQLNTMKILYDQLKKAASIPEVWEAWDDEDRATTRILIKDFEQSAIQESDQVRGKFVTLSNDIVQAGSDMLDNMSADRDRVSFSSSKLKGMDPVSVKDYTRWGKTTLPINSRAASLAMKTVDDPEVRRELYTASRKSSRGSVARVERLIQKRAELATLCGHQSFAHMTLGDKMAKTPQAVNQFLGALAKDNKQSTTSDLAELIELKKADARKDDPSNQLNAWDRQYYTRKLRSLTYAQNRTSEMLSSYFSLGTVMQGLSRLFTNLYGVHLVPRETSSGETWNDDVRRLDVIDEREGHIAVLYCDLFARVNKTPNPAHFTLRCSREISDAEIQEARHFGQLSADPSLDELSAALNDGMAVSKSPSTGSLNQLPVIAFICDFARSRSSTTPTLLTFGQVMTLFHEMGHALHSILGRTRLQNVAGTRCATDFAELPSILMEYFASSPQVLSTYARHWSTEEPLNVELVTSELQANRRLQASQETEAQILFSVLDQRYHSPEVMAQGRSFDSTQVYHDVYNNSLYSSVPEPRGASWQGFFGHLYGYGAVYYAYLFDRAIAGKVWSQVFKPQSGLGLGGPLDREAGQRYRDEVLKWGGSRDPWRCVAGVLGPEYNWMSEGGEQAMEEVGRWGVGEAGEAGSPM